MPLPDMLRLVQVRQVHTSVERSAGKLWRMSVGLPKLQTARGQLIDLPDYSFTDGRPVPLGVGQAKRKELQNQLGSDVVKGLQYLKKAQEFNQGLTQVPSDPLLNKYIQKAAQANLKNRRQTSKAN